MPLYSQASHILRLIQNNNLKDSTFSSDPIDSMANIFYSS